MPFNWTNSLTHTFTATPPWCPRDKVFQIKKNPQCDASLTVRVLPYYPDLHLTHDNCGCTTHTHGCTSPMDFRRRCMLNSFAPPLLLLPTLYCVLAPPCADFVARVCLSLADPCTNWTSCESFLTYQLYRTSGGSKGHKLCTVHLVAQREAGGGAYHLRKKLGKTGKLLNSSGLRLCPGLWPERRVGEG